MNSQATTDSNLDLPFLNGGGKVAERIRLHDWSATPLGPIKSWPQALKAAISIALQTPIPIVLLWGPNGVMIYNDAYIEFAGMRHTEQLGKGVREGWPEVAAFNDNVLKVCLNGGTLSYRDEELTLYRNGRAQQVWMNLDYSPVLDEEGNPAGVMSFVRETTSRVLSDRWISEEFDRLHRLFEQAPSFMAMLRGENYVFEMVNPGYTRLVGHRNLIGRPVNEAVPEVATQGFIDMLDTAFRTGDAVTGSAQPILLTRKPGKEPEQRFVDFVYQPIRNDENVVTHIFVQGTDVTERVVAERQQKMLMHELSHRVKNMMAVVSALATRTIRGAASLKDAEVSLTSRIMALARAQDILTKRTGEGAEIKDLIAAAIFSHYGDSERFLIEGPGIKLNADTALALSLALHELATNATKYGSLSVDAGTVSIRWEIEKREDDEFLRFIWEEACGPAVAPPTHRGFGSILIEDAVATETGGEAHVEYRPWGIRFTLDALLEAITTS